MIITYRRGSFAPHHINATVPTLTFVMSYSARTFYLYFTAPHRQKAAAPQH